MKNTEKALLAAAGALSAAIAAGGYGFYRYATVRNDKRQRDFWKEGVKDGEFDEESTAIIRDGEAFLKSHETERVCILSKDGLKLTGHRIDHPSPKGVCLLVHGYRSCGISDFAGIAEPLYERGFSLLVIDQRAHEESEGDKITFGAWERYDVIDWAEYLDEGFPGLPVIACGISMGAATVMMACEIGWPGNVKGLIADCGYTTPGAICRKTEKQWFHLPPFPLYYAAKAWVKLLAHYDTDGVSATEALKSLPEDHIPVLLAHGKADGFVPYSMSEENRTAFAEDDPMFELFSVEGADHGKSFVVDREGYLAAVDRLLAKAGL